MIQTRSRLRMASFVALLAMIAGAVAVTVHRESAKARNAAEPQPAMPPIVGPIARAELPLAFEANEGQAPSEARFFARARGGLVALTPNGAVVSVGGQRNPALFRMKFKAASPVEPVGLDELSAKANYFFGSDARKWHTGVSLFRQVKYADVYPRIDLLYYGSDRQLEYDFVVWPGADLARICWRIEGADRLELGARGELIVTIGNTRVVQQPPRVYQRQGSETQELSGAYVLASAQEVRFKVGDYDRTRPLVIDPVLVLSSFIGGNAEDYARGVAADNSGIYVVGSTVSPNFPTANAKQATLAGNFDVFLLKLDPTGSSLIYSTYLGGSANDFGSAIAVDGSGNAYITGWTSSTNFPTASARQPVKRSYEDAFVAKVSANGSTLMYSTYLGGDDSDYGRAIAVDGAGNTYVAGSTASTNFPVASAYQATKRSSRGYNAFVTKMSPSGLSLVYSTYLGGTLTDEAYGIAVDSSGAAYVVGTALSPDFPVLSAYQAQSGGSSDAFVAKFSASGTSLSYSTYLGGGSTDFGYGIAVDASGSAVVVGETSSTDFPIAPQGPAPTGALQQQLSGDGSVSADAFVTKLSPNGSTLVYSTYLGGGGADTAYGVALNSSGNAFVTGDTMSPNFPTLGSLQTLAGDRDVFVAQLNALGTALVYSTYLGGTAEDSGRSIALDSASNAFVAGQTRSADFPSTPGAFQTTLGGGLDVFAVKVGPSTTVTLVKVDPNTGPTAGGTAVSMRGANFASGATVTIGGASALNVVISSAGTISARTPAHATGPVDVVVTNPGGQSSTLTAAFNYADPPGTSSPSGGKGCGGAGAPLGAWLALTALLRRIRRPSILKRH